MAKKKFKKTDVIKVRVSVWEAEKLKSYAKHHGQSVSGILRSYIHRLPVQGELKKMATDSLDEKR